MPKTFNDYGPRIKDLLLKAHTQGVKLDDPLCTPARIGKLEAAGLIHKRQSRKGEMRWRVTDVGRGLVCAHAPVFLHRQGFPSYTYKPWQAMHAEGECLGEMNPDAASTEREKKDKEKPETLRESLAAMKARNAERFAA
jgi:hypothetical protein